MATKDGVISAPGSSEELRKNPPERLVKAKLTERVFFGGMWHEAGDSVDVYEREKLALVARGAAEGDLKKAESELGSSTSGTTRPSRGARPAGGSASKLG